MGAANRPELVQRLQAAAAVIRHYRTGANLIRPPSGDLLHILFDLSLMEDPLCHARVTFRIQRSLVLVQELRGTDGKLGEH